jgi:DNA repair exonuclease SbcCD ATPase subunit
MSQDKFSSKVPEHLLESETPAMKYLITELSKNTQATEFLLLKREESGVVLNEIKTELKKQGDKLENQASELLEIRTQTQKTNGSIIKHTAQIQDLNKNTEDLNQIVKIKKILEKLLTSKIFWVSITVVTILLVKSGFFTLFFNWLSNHLGI